MTGGNDARWTDETIADTLAKRAVDFIENAGTEPFFLFFSPHDFHEPMVPHPRFRGTSGCGWRGDVIQQLDWTVGEVLSALDRKGIIQNTLVIFTSDNGGQIKDTYDDGTRELQLRQPPNGNLRGHKGHLYEGGHRVPFLVRWPARVSAGTESSELICHIDLLASLSALVGLASPAGDGVNVLPALLGAPGGKGREELVLQNNGQRPLALRAGSWKLIEQKEGGPELYDLSADPGEQNDLSLQRSEKLRLMKERLAQIVGLGWSSAP